MCDTELIRSSLIKIQTALDRILKRSETIDKATNKELLSHYPEIDWKGVMGMRDIIVHHYFDIDAVIVFDVIKNNLPAVKMTIDKMLSDI